MLTSETFINCLEHLFPCTGLIYVGAGNGSVLNGERFNRISKLLAIEADDLGFSYLASNLQNRTGWTALKALVGEGETESIFFAASNPNESGLLNPEALKPIWRNITCLSSRPQASTTLSSVLQHECQSELYNWLSIDCLPSARILHGIDKYIEQFDVIDLRVVAHAAGIIENGCTKAECDALLEPMGYRAVFVEECGNPQILRALYVRDGMRRLEIQTDRLRSQYEIEVEQLSQDNVALKHGKAQLEQTREAAMQEKNTLLASCKLEQQRVAALEEKLKQTEAQQQRMNNELSKAEKQLEFIKELLLQES